MDFIHLLMHIDEAGCFDARPHFVECVEWAVGSLSAADEEVSPLGV